MGNSRQKVNKPNSFFPVHVTISCAYIRTTLSFRKKTCLVNTFFFSPHPLTSSCSNHTPDTSFPSLVSMMHFAIDFLFISKKTNGNDKRKKTKFRSVIISSPLKVIVSHGTTLSLFTHSGNLENRGNVCYR